MKQDNIYNKKTIPKYHSKDDILTHFQITEDELKEILDEIDRPKRTAYTYCYGIDRPKLDLFDICQMLQVSENVVKIYINQVDNSIEKKVKQKELSQQKHNFLDYFAKEDQAFALGIIENYKEKNHVYYSILVKVYGEHYDNLNTLVSLTKKEINDLNNFRQIIEIKIETMKQSREKKTRNIRKNSFLDYFEKEDQPLALKIIEEYKEKNKDEETTSPTEYNISMTALYEKFPRLRQEQITTLIVLTKFIEEREDVNTISEFTELPIQKIDYILLTHLYLFGYNMIKVIDEVLARGNYKAQQLTSIKFVETQTSYLNDKQKELLFLKTTKLYIQELNRTLSFQNEEIKEKVKKLFL